MQCMWHMYITTCVVRRMSRALPGIAVLSCLSITEDIDIGKQAKLSHRHARHTQFFFKKYVE